MALTAKAFAEMFTFTRSSSGSYMTATGLIATAPANTPRFEHDGVAGPKLGLLMEATRTNLVTKSEDFSDVAHWTTTGVTVESNSQLAPDGTLTAALISAQSAATNDGHIANPSPSLAGSSLSASVSFFVKPGSSSGAALTTILGNIGGVNSGGTLTMYINAAGDPVVATSIFGSCTMSNSRIVKVINGFYRVSATIKANAQLDSASAPLVRLVPAFSDTGVRTSGLNSTLWGVQFEVGATVSSYIKTDASSVTRVADEAYTSVSQWFNASVFTLAIKLSASNYDGFVRAFQFTSGPSQDYKGLSVELNNTGVAVYHRGSSFTGSSLFSGAAGKASGDKTAISVSILTNPQTETFEPKCFVDGLPLSINPGASLGLVSDKLDRLYIGSLPNSPLDLGGHISSIKVWPRLLTDSEMLLNSIS